MMVQSDRGTRWFISGGIGGFIGAVVAAFYVRRRLRRKS